MPSISSNLSPVKSLNVVCQRCRIQLAQGDDELCSDCRQNTRYAQLIQRGIRALMGWTATCIFDSLLGIGAATALVMPYAYVSASPPPSLQNPRTWFIGLAVLIVIALLVGAVQSLVLRDWIDQHTYWGMLSAIGILLTWPVVIGLVLLLGPLVGLLTVAEICVGLVIARLQAELLTHQLHETNHWFFGSAICWMLAAGASIWVETTYPQAIDRVVYAYMTSRLVYGALSGIIIGSILWKSLFREAKPASGIVYTD
jgi:hypothetical protein